jgi:hypothetical protein
MPKKLERKTLPARSGQINPSPGHLLVAAGTVLVAALRLDAEGSGGRTVLAQPPSDAIGAGRIVLLHASSK